MRRGEVFNVYLEPVSSSCEISVAGNVFLNF